MPNPISKIPIWLFHLKIETRFVRDELWIRAFPDGAFIQSHDPNLTSEEKSDAKAFKELNTEAQKTQAWEELVAKYGVYRSSWIVQISIQELASQADNDPVNEQEPSFQFRWLPDRLVYYLYRNGYRVPDDIAVTGFDNIPDAEFTFPPLTTVNVHKVLLGELAAERIVRRIENPDEVYLHILVPTSLIIRQSCRKINPNGIFPHKA